VKNWTLLQIMMEGAMKAAKTRMLLPRLKNVSLQIAMIYHKLHRIFVRPAYKRGIKMLKNGSPRNARYHAEPTIPLFHEIETIPTSFHDL
jgi:hypothetical protein